MEGVEGGKDNKDLLTGIPNEMTLPHLHAITYRRNLTIDNNLILPKSSLNDTTVASLS